MKELRTIIEGVFDDQDESVLIKAPDSILWKEYMKNITAAKVEMITAYDIRKTTIHNNPDKILRVVPRLHELTLIPTDSYNFYDYVPAGVEGLESNAYILLGAKLGNNKVVNNWTPKHFGKCVNCYLVRGSINSIRDIDVNVYYEFIADNIKSLTNVNIRVDQPEASIIRVVFRPRGDMPVFDNVSSNYHVYFRIDKALNQSSLNRIFDWSTPRVIHNKKGGVVYIQNTKDLISAMRLEDFNQIHNQYIGLYKIANVSMKDLKLDLKCPFIHINFVDCSVLLLSPQTRASKTLIEEYAGKLIAMNYPLIQKGSNFKTKDGWTVIVYRI